MIRLPLISTRCLSLLRKAQALAIFLVIASPAMSQKIATLELNLDHPPAGIAVPVQLLLDPITAVSPAELQLVEVEGKQRTPVTFQADINNDRKITWLVSDERRKRVYELRTVDARSQGKPYVSIERTDSHVTLRAGNTNLLRYQHGTMFPPEGVDPVFKRSGFIHPLWAPDGQVLTNIQPRDHYHHYGLWNPWTHVAFEGDTVDFWNLKARQGTVRFANFVSMITGDVFGQYEALHEHVAFQKDGTEKIAINELQTVRVYAPTGDAHYYIADITVRMNCPESAVRLLEYRYGGMGWRATEAWTKDNSTVLTSEGKTRKNADGSTARWCLVSGTVDDKTAGAVIMSAPTNFNHPEPLRIWPENANGGRGDMFANFAPTKNTDWQLDVGKNYVLNYRFIVFNGNFPKEKAEAAWHYFASPPTPRVVKRSGSRL